MNWFVKQANRHLAFTPSARFLFFTMLAEYEASGVPLIDTLEIMSTMRETKVVADVAELCLMSISQNESIAKHATELGYFTEREAALLAIGEKYEKLSSMVGLIIEQMEGSSTAFNKMIRSKGGVLFSIAMIAYITTMLDSLRRTLKADYLALELIDFARANGVFLLAVFIVLIFLYIVARKSVIGESRIKLNRLGLFKVNDTEAEHAFLTVCGALAKARVEPDEIYETLIEMLNDQPYLTERMVNARNDLETIRFEHSLPNVISEYSYVNIRAKAPNGAIEEIGQGCDLARRLIMERLTLNIAAMSETLDAVLYAFMFFLAYPVIMMSSGSGFSI